MPDQKMDPSAPISGARRLGERIRLLRQNAGLTRSELGTLTGLTSAMLLNLEQGMPAKPSTWRALLKHPSMHEVPELAAQEGVSLNLGGSETPVRRTLTVAETIDLYLDSMYVRGVRAPSIVTVAHTLRSVFRPAMSEHLDTLSPERTRYIVNELAARVSPHTRRPLTPRTYQAYCDRARAFLAWCVLQRRLPSNPLEPSVADISSTEREENPNGNR